MTIELLSPLQFASEAWPGEADAEMSSTSFFTPSATPEVFFPSLSSEQDSSSDPFQAYPVQEDGQVDSTSAPAEEDKEASANLSAPEEQTSSTKTAVHFREYRRAHAEKIRAYDRVYYQTHRKVKLARTRKFYQTHKDEILAHHQARKDAKAAYDKAYQLAHKVEIAARRQRRRTH